MPADLTTVDKILKEIYEGKIQDQLQDEAVGWKRIEKTSKGVTSEVGGKYVTFPLRVRRNHGIGYRGEGQQLQEAGQQGYQNVRIGLRYGYGRVQLTGQTMELADSNFQAFSSALDQEMTGIKNDIGKDTNRIFYGDGQGTLAKVATAAAINATTIVVDSVKYLELGMQIDVVSPAGSIRDANLQIIAINRATKTVTVSDPITSPADPAGLDVAAAVGDLLVRTGNFGKEPNGLGNLVSVDATTATNVHGLSTATEATWGAVIDTNGTDRPLSENMMIKNTDDVRVNGGKTSVMLCSLGVRRAYFNLLSQQRRYPSTTKFEGGLTGLAFNNGREIPVVEDIDCPDGTIFGLDEDVFKIYRNAPWSWMNRDGNIWKWKSNFDAYEAVIHQYWELGLNKRNANFKIDRITEA